MLILFDLRKYYCKLVCFLHVPKTCFRLNVYITRIAAASQRHSRLPGRTVSGFRRTAGGSVEQQLCL